MEIPKELKSFFTKQKTFILMPQTWGVISKRKKGINCFAGSTEGTLEERAAANKLMVEKLIKQFEKDYSMSFEVNNLYDEIRGGRGVIISQTRIEITIRSDETVVSLFVSDKKTKRKAMYDKVKTQKEARKGIRKDLLKKGAKEIMEDLLND